MKWIDVKGFEGLYKVNEKGDVVTNYNRNGKKGHTLKASVDKDGYSYVKLYKDGKYSHKRINRLVAEAFIPNPENKPCVNHKDCDRSNDSVDNLEWCTAKENVQHSVKLGRYKGNNYRKVGLINDFGIIVPFESIHEAERMTNVPAPNIYKCCVGQRKSAGGFKWTFIEEVG